MPFPQQEARLFTKAGIEWLRPNQYGVYGIFRADAWIYVGRGDLRARLLDHFGGNNPDITKEKPTGYVTEVKRNEVADFWDNAVEEWLNSTDDYWLCVGLVGPPDVPTLGCERTTIMTIWPTGSRVTMGH
jgi:hypothetical protein